MAAKVVEGEASHALNTSEGEGMDGGGAFQTQCVDLSGVVHVLSACEGVYRVTLPHPPVRPVSLVSSHVSRVSHVSCTSCILCTPPPIVDASPACRTSTTVLSTTPSRSSSARTRKVSCT